MKIVASIAFASFFFLVGGCAVHKYASDAEIFCSANGYDFDEARYKECVDYIALKIDKKAKGEPFPTQAEFLCQKEKILTESAEYATCIKEKEKVVVKIQQQATAQLVARDKAEKERIKQAQLEAKRIEKERLKAIALQKAADVKQCRGYGFRSGTDKMASCVMQLEQGRIDRYNQQAAQQAYLQQQAEIAEQQRRQAAADAWLNYSAQQQQTQAINNMAFQQQMRSMQPVRLQTSCSRLGNTVNCY